MRTVTRRIRKLEVGAGLIETDGSLLVFCRADRELALDTGRCIQILRESGFLPTGPFGIVPLWQVPDGLNAEELERYLRENGTEAQRYD